MGKKKKNSYKKQLRKFMKSNRVILAALTGAATGIAIAGILGTERAKEIVNTVEASFREMAGGEKPRRNSYQNTGARESKKESTPAT